MIPVKPISWLVSASSTIADSRSLVLFVDLQKGFDSVWIDSLIFKLHQSGIRGNMLKTLYTFLKNRQLKITINDYTHHTMRCQIGIPQGSVLSPTLFSLFISDMLMHVNGTPLQYADDMSIILSSNSNIRLKKSHKTPATN